MNGFLKGVIVVAVLAIVAVVGWGVFLYIRFEQMAKKPIVYAIPGMDEISPRRNLVYKTNGDEKLLADLYLPVAKHGQAAYPVVIFIHGAVPEGVKPKDWAAYMSWGRLLASSGIAAITFNLRLYGSWKGGYDSASVPIAATDVEDLVRYVRDNGVRLGVDPDRICLAAFSAGGPLLSVSLRQSPAYVRCYVGFYSYLGDPMSPNSPDAGRFSPLVALKSPGIRIPPMFIAKADLDQTRLNGTNLNETITSFVDADRAIGSEVTLVEHPNGRHGFDIVDDDDTSRAIIKKAVQFMKSHLEPN
jgi:acetyl esterase/lipase